MHVTVFLCPVLFRRFDCALRKRNFNCPRLVRPICICRSRCHRDGLTKHRSSGPSFFPPLFLVISHHHNQLLGILLAKAALSHPLQSHIAPSLILLAVVLTSACNVLIVDNVPFTLPFARIGTDGACRSIIVMQRPSTKGWTHSCSHLDWSFILSFAQFKRSLSPLLPRHLYQIGRCNVYVRSSYERDLIGQSFPLFVVRPPHESCYEVLICVCF